jgi:hypothetical protein
MRIITILLAVMIACAAASDLRAQNTIVRPDVNGKPTRIPVARTLAECIAGGMKLGHPRVGPNGPDDRRGALGFCRSRGFK